MGEIPEIDVEVTFLSEEEGGRSAPLDLSTPWYRPHLVVGNPDQREPALGNDKLTAEDYLGVQFVPVDRVSRPGETTRARLQLIYFPQVDYGALTKGASFTVREGSRIVAFGRVVNSASNAP